MNFVEATWKGSIEVKEMEFARNKREHENVRPPGNRWKSWEGLWIYQVAEWKVQSNSLDSKEQRGPY